MSYTPLSAKLSAHACRVGEWKVEFVPITTVDELCNLSWPGSILADESIQLIEIVVREEQEDKCGKWGSCFLHGRLNV